MGYLSIVKASLSKRGWWSTFRMALSDLSFDGRYGSDTRGMVEVGHLDPDESGNLADASEYQPVNAWVVRSLLRRVARCPGDETLIDYGAGKGRVLIVAAELGFRRIIGIEFSPHLVSTAVKNIELYRKRSGDVRPIEMITADAASVEVDGDTTLAFLFNPFGKHVMSGVVDAIGRSLARKPRHFRVAYVNPLHGDLWTQAGFEEEMRMVSSRGHVEAIVYRAPKRVPEPATASHAT